MSAIKRKFQYFVRRYDMIRITTFAGIACGWLTCCLGILVLITTQFVTSKIGPEQSLTPGEMSLGMSGYCIKLPAQQRTSFVAVDTCQPYGLDLLSDWPNPSWAACVILTGVGVVYSLVPAVGGIINRYIIRALDPFITICCAFNTFLFFLVCVIFPAELHNMVGVPAIGEVTACWDGGSYSPGSYCSYASGYGAMWGCFIISLATTGCFGYSAYFVSGSGAFA